MLMSFNPLEAEAIHIFREVAAEAENPVFFYSVGKDSAFVASVLRNRSLSMSPCLLMTQASGELG